MQTDENYLNLRYRPRWWKFGRHGITSTVPEGQDRVRSYIPVANQVAAMMAKKMKGYPKSMWSEVLLDAPTTAHILGGCSMADSPDDGVVGFDGQVFGYPNLFVADGSVVPANLGVNPSLTITALSEYIMSQVPDKAA
jgi:cholesterol oxidase